MELILGINSYLHDTSAVLIRDGEVVAAVEEERFVGKKHAPGICLGGLPPYRSIEWILSTFNITLDDISGFAHSCRLLRHDRSGAWQAERNEYELFARSLDPTLKRTVFFPHHLCHAASAFLCSGMEEALIVTADGGGDSVATAIYVGRNKRIHPLAAFPVTSSLGHLYTYVTSLVGLGGFGKEGTTMALASYGERSDFPEVIVRTPLGYGIWDDWKSRLAPYETDYRKDFRKAANLARWVQEEVENTILHLIRVAIQITGLRNVCLAGGIFLNCMLNTKVATLSGVNEVFVPPGCNDAGTALGAGLLLASRSPHSENRRLVNAALGPVLDLEELETLLPVSGFRYFKVDNPHEWAARLLAAGRLVGWMQGRMEFGPRALGQRSILLDPRRSDLLPKLNAVKLREPWRPYAPAVLEDAVSEWFSLGVQSPFMTMVDWIKESKRSAVPAVVHVDGSARLQTVNRKNELWPVVDSFSKVTGIPMILNTSLNRQAPILQSTRDALALLATSPLDVLIAGSWVVSKEFVNDTQSA